MKISAIIPVKTFSIAKQRLELEQDKKIKLCKIMFEQVLQTLDESEHVEKVVVVSKDEDALKIGKKFNTIPIIDENESGVNNAVSMADNYLKNNNISSSVVFPQDIPLIQPQDIDFLLNFQSLRQFILVVPSQRFDGTNALVRMPVDIMETHYDEDSYKIHLSLGKTKTKNTSLVFIRRIMMDVDTLDDLNLISKQNEKPDLAKKIRNLIS